MNDEIWILLGIAILGLWFSLFIYKVYDIGYKKGYYKGKREGFKECLEIDFKVGKEVIINSYIDHINSRIN